MQRQWYSCSSALVLVVFPALMHCIHSGDYRVLILKSGPVKNGEITSFRAEVVPEPKARTRHGKNEKTAFEFSWKIASKPWVKHQMTTQRWDNFYWQWTEAGDKTVFVYVRILNDNGHDSTYGQRFYNSYYASNRTQVTVTESEDKINATLDAYQNTTGDDQDHHLYAGTVTLKLTIHNFLPQDLGGIAYNWDLGDGTLKKDSRLTQLSHNFTTVRTCTVVVYLHGFIQGRFYSGFAHKELKFKVLLYPYLVVKSSAGPKLPSNLLYALPRNSPIEFEVKFKDPFKQVANVSTDWKFGDDSTVTEWQKTRIYHTFRKEGKYSLWVTIRVTTKDFGKKSCAPIGKTLHVKAPVSLEVIHKHLDHADKTVRFNISCNGSLPVSFLWCISKQCNLLPGEMCSPTMEHNSSCSLIVNHRFSVPGEYCVNVGVMNDVSGTNTSLMVRIPGDDPSPTPSSGKLKASITGLVVTVVISCILLIVVVIAARKWIYSRIGRRAEKADFEFRDADALSVSSVELAGNRACFAKCGMWGLQETGENVPLCRGTRMYTL